MHNKTPIHTARQTIATGVFASLDPIIRLKEFLRLTGLGRSTVYNLISEGKIERPLLISSRAIGWRASTVDAYLRSLQARPDNRRIDSHTREGPHAVAACHPPNLAPNVAQAGMFGGGPR
jgi:prophage regulatory protein